MKTLSADGKPLSEEATREHIQQDVDHWQQHGFGFWVFHRKTDGVFIGRGGLKTYQIDGKDVIGLAYAVMPDYWNQGFATEMAPGQLGRRLRAAGIPRNRFMDAADQSGFPAGDGEAGVPVRAGFRVRRAAASVLPAGGGGVAGYNGGV